MSDNKNILIQLGVVFTLLVLVAGGIYLSRANDDDGGNGGGDSAPACFTRMVTDTVKTSCAVESWSDWQDSGTPQETQSCYYKIAQTRTGTGFLNVYTETYDAGGCTPSYSASSYKKACQVEETRNVTKKQTVCGNDDDPTDDKIVATEDEILTSVTEGQTVDSSTRSYASANQMLSDALELKLSADPQIVRQGATTTLSYMARSVTNCELKGTNGDSWTYTVANRTTEMLRGVSGKQESSPLQEEVTYTLSCRAFNGQNVSESVKVKVVPTWQEN